MKSAERVAVNTFVHYVQLVLNVLIGLFSVRIILSSLGAVDYGVYNLLGGIITLLSFLSNSLSQTSIRFISVSLGTRDMNKIRDTFDACFSLHFIIALALCLILEFAGLFLFDGFLDIPADRIRAAKVVYHCMVVTVFLNISVTPFKGVLVAHEKFVYISIVGILDSILKLLIAFWIAAVSSDKLVLYGILMATIVVINVTLYAGYVFIRYSRETSFGKFDWKAVKDITGFAGWTLLDVLGSLINRQGYAVVLNKFFGPVVNASYAVAGQVEGHMYTISSSVVNTIKPQIMKSQGEGDTKRVLRLSMTAGKFGFSMMSLISIPLIVMMPEALELWLKEVPEGTVFFSRIMIIACMFEQLTRGLVHANQAIGNIKWFSIIVSCIRIMALPVSTICFLCGAGVEVSMYVFLAFETLGSFSRVVVMSRTSGLDIGEFIHSVLFNILPPFAVAFVVCIFAHKLMGGIWGMVAACIITDIVYALLLFFFGLTKEEHQSVDVIFKLFFAKLGLRR